MIEKIDHIGIAVENLAKGLELYQDLLKLRLVSITVVEEQRVKVAKLAVGDVIIELLEPTDPDSPVAKFLAARGSGIHHLAFRTADPEATVADLATRELQSLSGVHKGADGAQVAFFHPKQTLGVLIEITTGGFENEA